MPHTPKDDHADARTDDIIDLDAERRMRKPMPVGASFGERAAWSARARPAVVALPPEQLSLNLVED